MKVRILFFAQLKDAFGESEQVIETEDGTTVHQFVQFLMSKGCGDAWKFLPLRYAVNERFEGGKTELCDGDTLALLPPVSGG